MLLFGPLLYSVWLLLRIKMADLIEKLVGQWLPEADVAFLTEKCTELNLAIPGDKADNQAYLVTP